MPNLVAALYGDEPATILVVEDEIIIRMNLADFLADEGYTVLEASNAAEAVGILCNAAQRVDLVLSDVRMPGEMDGLGLASWLQEHHKGLPVILTSGDVGQGNTQMGFAGVRFLGKPYHLRDVAEKITEVMRPIAA